MKVVQNVLVGQSPCLVELKEQETADFFGGFDGEGGPEIGEPMPDDAAEEYYWETWEEFEEFFEEIIYGFLPDEFEEYFEEDPASAALPPDETLLDDYVSAEEYFDALLGLD